MVKKYVKLAILFTLVFVVFIVLPVNSFAYSSEEVIQNLNMPYATFYDDDNNLFCALYENSLGKSNFSSTLSPIGADMYPYGSYTYFKLPYGSMLPGMIVYYTFQSSQGFIDSVDWFDFFNTYISNSTNQNSALTYAVNNSNIIFTLTDYIQFEKDICYYAYNSETYLVFSSDFIQFMYRYSYWMLYHGGMFTGSYDEYVAQAYKMVSSVDYLDDIAFNPNFYTDSMYSFAISNISADYIPINNQFENFTYTNNFYILGGLFDLLNSDINDWMPASYVSAIGVVIGVLVSVTSLMFIKKIVPGA